MNRLTRLVLLSAALITTHGLAAQDLIRVARTAALPGDTVTVGVYVGDASLTPLGSDATAIRGISFKVRFGGLSSISFERDGILKNLTPLYERTVQSDGGIAYIAAFDQPVPFTPGASSARDRIGTLTCKVSSSLITPASVTLSIDPYLTALADESGTLFETQYDKQLHLDSGLIALANYPTTATTVSSSANPTGTGQSVTLTATVSGGTGIGGTVVFRNAGESFAWVEVQDGVGSYTTSALPGGSHAITALYEGDASHLGSTSAIYYQTVLDAPDNVVATASSPYSATISWSESSGAAWHEVYRSSNNGEFVHIASTPSGSFGDSTLSPGTTYVYRVRAATEYGASPFSAIDIATTILFEDDPLVPGVTKVRSIHLSELRSAVNAVRVSAGLAPATFTDSSTTGLAIRKVHIEELRSALSAARSALGLSAVAYTDPVLSAGATTVKAIHLQEIRNAVK